MDHSGFIQQLLVPTTRVTVLVLLESSMLTFHPCSYARKCYSKDLFSSR